MALARAGVGELRLLDHDFVDPATIGRWEFGLSAVGRHKVDVIKEAIERDYPLTKVAEPYRWRIGGVRDWNADSDGEGAILQVMTAEVSAIYDATAEVGVNRFLSDYARRVKVPYILVAGTPGGWGGEVVRIAPGVTEGCWYCYQHWWAESECEYGKLVAREDDGVQPVGCGDPTYTGAGFDLAQTALSGVRMLVSTLCGGTNGAYPATPFDILLSAYRTEDGKVCVPEFRGYQLRRHPNCAACKAS